MYVWYEILTNPENGKDYGDTYIYPFGIGYDTDEPSEACLMIPKPPGDWDCE